MAAAAFMAGAATGAGVHGLTLQSVHANAPASVFSPTWTYTDDPGGTASWTTPSGSSTYAFPVPAAIPAGGVTITVTVTAMVPSSVPPGNRWAPALGIASALVSGGHVAVSTIAERGKQESNSASAPVKLVPNGSSPVTLTVGLQDGPTFTYTFVSSSAMPPAGGGFGSLSAPARFCPAGAVPAGVRGSSGSGDSGARAARSLASLCAATKAVTAAEKAAARVELKAELRGTAILCGLWMALQARQNTQLTVVLDPAERAALDEFFSGNEATRTAMYASWKVLCETAVGVMADTLAQVHDPADRSFLKVARPLPPQLPAPGGHCPASVSASACGLLLAAKTAYVNAVATTASFGQAAVVTTDRFAGAIQAKSVAGAFLQNAVGKIYAGEQAGALTAQQTAGAALAAELRADHLDAAFSPAATKQVVSATTSRAVLSNALLATLVSDGVASNPAQARALLTGALNSVSGTIDLAAMLSGPLPASAFDQHYRSITLRELAAIVRALAAQHALTAAASQTLTADIASAQQACANASQRATAIQKFNADAAAHVYQAAAQFLEFGAQPLLAATVSASACQ